MGRISPKKTFGCGVLPPVVALLCLALLSSLGGCASSETALSTSHPMASSLNKVWPPPPQKERIRYLGNITSFSGGEEGKNWVSKALSALLGTDKSSAVLLRPYGVYSEGERLYVTDPGLRRLHIINRKEGKYLQIDTANQETLVSPIGVAADKDGRIYLSDSVLRKVFVYDSGGSFMREIGSPQIFERPAGIALDEDRVYVVDTHGHRITVFSKADGKVLFDFGKKGTGPGEFNYPTNIFRDKEGILYITDAMNFRVVIADRNGNVLSSFGRHGDGSGDLSKPKGIAVDSEGHIYVVDAHFDNVQIFDHDGTLLLAFSGTGRGPGEIVLPAGIFIDDNDTIYVADSYNRRIQVFQYIKQDEAASGNQ